MTAEDLLSVQEDQAAEAVMAMTQSLLERMDRGQAQESEIEATIAGLVSTKDSAREFFGVYLTDGRPLADSPSPGVLRGLQSSAEIVGEFLLKTVVMSSAMAVAHRRRQDQKMAASSLRVRSRCVNLIQNLELPAIPALAKEMRDSASAGSGAYQAFLDRWGYDAEQRQVIAEVLQPLAAGSAVRVQVSQRREPVASLGHLDVAIESGVLRLGGWVASFSAGPVDGFKVSFAGRELTEFEVQRGLSSPGVKKAFPDLDCAETAVFSIRAPLEEWEGAREGLVILTPLFSGREGRMLFSILGDSLPVPSQEEADLIGGNFYLIAFEFLGHLLQRAGLRPSDCLLDVGCGFGRMAYSLAYYLTPAARYEGFDIMANAIEWAQQTISPRFPNFRFGLADICNPMYSPNGRVPAEEFIFPYEGESFDFVLLSSVFTHMRAGEVRHYLDEIRRVLKSGGRCLCTCFLLNEESQLLVAAGKSSQNLVYELEDCFTASTKVPEAAIGFREPLLLQWIAELGFSVRGQYGGSWCGRAEFTTYQDMLILEKK